MNRVIGRSGDRVSIRRSRIGIREEFRLLCFGVSVHPIIGAPDQRISPSRDHSIKEKSWLQV